MSNIAKISVEKHESKEQFLYDLDKNKSFCEVIRDICKTSGLPASTVYGLKLIQTKKNPFINTYLSESTYREIQHSDCLKIVFSIEYLLNNRILLHINDENGIERDICYEGLEKLAVDSVFIDELAKSKSYLQIIDTYIHDELNDKELKAVLMTICHLLHKGYINNTSQDIVTKSINIVKTPDENSEDNIKYTLSILHKILMQKSGTFLNWKEKIIQEVTISELNQYISTQNWRDLKYGVLLLINTIIRLCKGERKTQLIKEINLKQNRQNIYQYIIEARNLDKSTEHELYVIQTYILSLNNEALNTHINLDGNTIFKREDFELSEEDVRRLTVLIDFDTEDTYQYKFNSVENLIMTNAFERLSLESTLSDISRKSSVRSTSISMDYENTRINLLTLEALNHYKKHHYKIFYQSQIEEKVYEPGIFETSERVVKILAKLLHIGMDPPDSKSVFYQPLVFSCTSRMPFFLELFSRSMWLLSKTRREMKVSTKEDYPKVMSVLEKQLKIILSRRPRDLKSLTNEMSDINFETVLTEWQKTRDEEMNDLLKNNPCIHELKQMYTKENEIYVERHRLNVLKEGSSFPKVFEKKTSGSIYVQLSKNERELHIFDITNRKTNSLKFQQKIPVTDITHVAAGLNCKHSNLCKSPSLVFSIIINHSESQVNFIAKDERIANYWTDAFHILTGNNKRSSYFQKELDDLVEMDIRLRILDLQNVSIPKKPPPVPKPPSEIKPPIPPKSPALLRLCRRKR